MKVKIQALVGKGGRGELGMLTEGIPGKAPKSPSAIPGKQPQSRGNHFIGSLMGFNGFKGTAGIWE